MKLDDRYDGFPSSLINSSNPLYRYIYQLELSCGTSFIFDTTFKRGYSDSRFVSLYSTSLSSRAKRIVGDKGLINISTRSSSQEKCIELEFSFESNHYYANKTKVNTLIQYLKQQSNVEVIIPTSTILHIDYHVPSIEKATVFFRGLNEQLCKIFTIYNKYELIDELSAFWKKLAPVCSPLKNFSIACRLRSIIYGSTVSRIMELVPVSTSEAQISIQTPSYTFRSTRFMPHCLDKKLIYNFDVMKDCTKVLQPYLDKIKLDQAFIKNKEEYTGLLTKLKVEMTQSELNEKLLQAMSNSTEDLYSVAYMQNNVEYLRKLILS